MSCSGEGVSGQQFDALGLTDFGMGIDHFLAGVEELLGELSKVKHFSFNEGISQSSHSSVDEVLVRLPLFEDSLAKGMKGGLSALVRSSP